MGYKVDYGAMKALLGAYSSAVNSWNEGISSVMDAEAAIEASTSISGDSADRMREYLNTVYSCAGVSLSMLIELFRQNFLLYTEAYYQQIDPSRDTRIDEMDLSERRIRLQGKRSQLQQIGLAAENSVRGISDLISITSLDISEPDAELGKILKSLDELDNAVNGLESTHVSSDFTEIDALIAKIDAYLTELIGIRKEQKTNFTIDSYTSLASVPTLLLAIKNAYEQLNAQESDVALAVKNMEKRLEEERAEIAKRQEQAEWAKIGMNVAVGLASAAFLVTAGPLGVIAIGAIGGATSAVFSAAADEYAEKGWDTQNWNMERIKIYGCVGLVTGMIESSFSGAGSCAEAGIKALSSVFEEVASTSYDQVAAYGRITDVRAIANDAIVKSGSTFVSSLIGSAVSNQVSDFVKQNSTIKDLAENVVGGKKHFGAVLLVEGSSDLASGAVKRFSSTAIEETGGFITSIADGKSVVEAYDEHNILYESIQKTVELKSVVSDIGGAVTTAAFDDPLIDSQKKLENREDDYYKFGDSPDLNGKEDAWKDWDSEEYDRMMESLAELDERGDDARNYEVFGDPRAFPAQRSDAVKEAWEQERRLVMKGRGTRDWSVSQQEELIRTGKVSGFDAEYMLNASSNPSEANNPDNIQFLTYEERIYGTHGVNTRNPTTGMFDPTTDETDIINARQISHREKVASELSKKFDFRQEEIAKPLESSFDYGRASKTKDEKGKME